MWLLLIALNVFMGWKYLSLNRTLKISNIQNDNALNSENFNDKFQKAIKHQNFQELSIIIEDISKEEQLTQHQKIKKLVDYFHQPIDSKMDVKVEVKGKKYKINTFQSKIQTLHPTLTDQEIMLCCYVLQNRSCNEIALMLGLTSGTVRVYKNKLKTKLGLSFENSLHDYIQKIDRLN